MAKIAKKNKAKFWTIQRVFALFVMITAVVQIINAVSSTTWRDQVTSILQTRHRYFSDDVADASSAINIVWWIIILLGSLLLFTDRDLETFFKKAFER